MPFSEQIRKVKGGWKVRGESKLYRTRKAVEKRARQRMYFENLSRSGGGKGSLKSKLRKKSLLK